MQEIRQQDIRHFELPDMLDSSEVVCLNLETLTFSLLNQEPLRMLTEVRLGSNDALLLVVLLESAPFYAPYESLLAVLSSGLAYSQKSISRFQEMITEEDMSNLRSAIHGLRPKLKSFCLTIKALNQLGYQLVRLPKAR